MTSKWSNESLAWWVLEKKIVNECWDYVVEVNKAIERVQKLSKNICTMDQINPLDGTGCLVLPILNNATDAISLKTPNWKYVYANIPFADILWLKLEEIIWKTDAELFSQTWYDSTMGIDNSILELWTIHQNEEEIIINGKKSIFLSRKWPIFDKDWNIKFLFYCSTNISEAKKTEQFNTKHQQIVQTMGSLSNLVAWIAHDFNNILTPILWYTELALLEKNSKEVAEFLQLTLDASIKAKQMVETLKNLSWVDQTLKMNTDIYTIIRRVINELPESDITINIEVKENTFEVFCNYYNLQIAIENIIINSIMSIEQKEQTEEGLITISVNEYVCDCDNLIWGEWEKFIHIKITDNWIWIPEENINNVFSPWFTSKSLDSKKWTGYWLTEVYKLIVRDHSWFVDIESIKWEWTTFHMYLPVIIDN